VPIEAETTGSSMPMKNVYKSADTSSLSAENKETYVNIPNMSK
jgi:hypothetical protein